MKAAVFSLVALTLNASGPRHVAQGWPTRREMIVARLKAEAPDVAAFQEVWRADDLDALRAAAGADDAVSSPRLGLAVLLRRARAAQRSERDLGGGWGALRARASDGTRQFDVYSARLEPGEGRAAARRVGQLFRLAEYVRSESAGTPFLLLGDLGAPSDERHIELLLDLIEARDLCVAHGDEVCGRTLGDRRVDYALIPYSSRPPREYARATFTDPLPGEDGAAPVAARFGLRVGLGADFPRLKPALRPQGRAEALAAVAAAAAKARADAERLAASAGWLPFWGTRESLAARAEAADFAALEEEVRTAQIRDAAPATPVAPD